MMDRGKSDLDVLDDAIARATAEVLKGDLDHDARRGLMTELDILKGMRQAIIERARKPSN